MIPLLKDGARRPFTGKLLLLGQGDIYFDLPHLRRMAKLASFPLNETVPLRPSHIKSFAEKGYPHAETVFGMLGFSSVTVLDYSAFEGAGVIFDLNSAELPLELHGQFDMIIDHGTLEHVFHLPNALSSVFRLLKDGGRVMFSAPSGNFFDHGFYMLQPTLFSDWLSANRWQIDSIQVVQYTPNQETEPCFFADYEPGLFDAVSYGKLDNKLYATVSFATKVKGTTSHLVPQQGAYARQSRWTDAARTSFGAARSKVP
jgi:SAM-dependent methyltransferase